jgi:hypothetical protein
MKWEKMGRSKFRGGMGFRDLETFNLALLAKRGWRFLHNPDSLVSRIMKENYFPNDSFMHARLGSKPSYAWRSIFQAREVLEKGLVWRVGNGEQIHIWGDKWLPTPSTFAVQSPVRVLRLSTQVVDLIDSDSGWWNVDLIRTIFNPKEAEVICGLVLSPLKQSDKLVWNETILACLQSRVLLIWHYKAGAKVQENAQQVILQLFGRRFGVCQCL